MPPDQSRQWLKRWDTPARGSLRASPDHWALTASQLLDRAIEQLQQHGTADGRNISDEVSHLRELAELEQKTGTPYCTVLRFKTNHPDMHSADMATRLGADLGTTLTRDAVRKTLKLATGVGRCDGCLKQTLVHRLGRSPTR